MMKNTYKTKKAYCENCKKQVNAIIHKGKETYKVLSEDITINATYLVCPTCGEKIYNELLDSKTLDNVYNTYRKKHNLLKTEEIKQIREKYNLSQNEFSNLLGWGEKTICRYENGSIQDNVHNDLLKLINDPINMKKFINENYNRISNKTYQKIINAIDNIKENCKEALECVYDYEPSEYSGFKKFDYEKLCSMVSYFVSNDNEISKTKLFKLLSYADNIYFKNYCVSISGLRYQHLQFGPVPERHNLLIDALNNDEIISENIVFNVYEKHLIQKGNKEINDCLTAEEKDILKKVYKKFKDYTAQEISEYSHHEKGYTNTNTGDYISYEYAIDIKD